MSETCEESAVCSCPGGNGMALRQPPELLQESLAGGRRLWVFSPGQACPEALAARLAGLVELCQRWEGPLRSEISERGLRLLAAARRAAFDDYIDAGLAAEAIY